MYNKDLMRTALTDSGLKQNYVASRLGIDQSTFSAKLSGTREFKASEIDAIRNLLRLSAKDVERIFFA